VDARVNGAKFWGYTRQINGTLTLRYEKKDPKAGEAIPVTGTFDRKEVVSNGEVTVTWKLQVKACNPDCGG
jgi:hypothetical protein